VFDLKVTGINWNATVNEIKDFFSEFTTVKWVNLIKDHRNRSKGIAYIKVADQESLDKAIANSQIEFQERPLLIVQAPARQPRTESQDRRPR